MEDICVDDSVNAKAEFHLLARYYGHVRTHSVWCGVFKFAVFLSIVDVLVKYVLGSKLVLWYVEGHLEDIRGSKCNRYVQDENIRKIGLVLKLHHTHTYRICILEEVGSLQKTIGEHGRHYLRPRLEARDRRLFPWTLVKEGHHYRCPSMSLEELFGPRGRVWHSYQLVGGLCVRLLGYYSLLELVQYLGPLQGRTGAPFVRVQPFHFGSKRLWVPGIGCLQGSRVLDELEEVCVWFE